MCLVLLWYENYHSFANQLWWIRCAYSLIRKSFRPIANCHTYEDSRLLGITIKSDTESLHFLNTYLPYQCDDKYDLYVEYLGKIVPTVDESSTSHIVV